MRKFINLKNKRFGEWYVLRKSLKKDKKGHIYWKCLCNCGKIKTIRGSCLIQGHTKSCRHNNPNFKHGLYKSSFYHIWQGLKARCNNPNCSRYRWYGERGIIHNPKWHIFLNFKKEMYFKYLYAIKQLKIKQPSIERINVNGNYYFDNCCFIELKNQAKIQGKQKLHVDKRRNYATGRKNNSIENW